KRLSSAIVVALYSAYDLTITFGFWLVLLFDFLLTFSSRHGPMNMTSGKEDELNVLDVHAATRAANGNFAKHVNVAHGTFRCRRGYNLHTTTYTPLARRSPACLVFHHGLADHAARHGVVLGHLCASLGMPVYTYDAHGHGLSGPSGPMGRALIRSFDDMVDDLLDFTRQLVVPAEEQAVVVGEATQAEAVSEAGAACEGGDGDGDATAGVGMRLRKKVQQQREEEEREQEQQQGMNGNRATKRKPRIFLMGYSMGGLTCCLAVAVTSLPASSSSPSTAPAAEAEAAASKAGEAAGTSPSCPAPASTQHQQQPGSETAANGTSGVTTTTTTNGNCVNGCSTAAHNGCTTSSNNSTNSTNSLFEGLMLTSCLTDPMFGASPLMRLVKLAFVTAVAQLAPALPMLRRNPVESGIRDPAGVAQMAADTLWYRGKFKAATVASMLWGCTRLRWLARRIRLPLYVQHATVDTSCSLPSMRAFLGRVGARDVTLHVVQGAYHDLHHDPETPVLLGRMVEWLGARM
ncbi:hypothetical protein Agub_g12837, partial [Astrephomene gubernaculifera]